MDRDPAVVVIPRGGAWGERVAAAARERGLAPCIVPMIADGPPEDPRPLDAAIAALRSRRTADVPSWVVATSATTIRILAERTGALPDGVKVAVVGPATAAAARSAGWPVDLMPEQNDAGGLVTAFPPVEGAVLVPHADLASPVVVDGLRSRGIDVIDVVAYRTVGTGEEPIHFDHPPAAVLVTSGSVAREVARRIVPLDPSTRIACIGPRTESEARAAGLPVHVVATRRTAESLLDAVAADAAERSVHPTSEPSTERRS